MDDDSTSSTSMEVDDGLPSGSSLATNVEPYTDSEHREMDEAVARRLGQFPVGDLEKSTVTLLLVLQQVIRGDDRLDPKNLETAVSSQLLKQYPSLAPKVVDAWKTGSYRHIRELGMHANHE